LLDDFAVVCGGGDCGGGEPDGATEGLFGGGGCGAAPFPAITTPIRTANTIANILKFIFILNRIELYCLRK